MSSKAGGKITYEKEESRPKDSRKSEKIAEKKAKTCWAVSTGKMLPRERRSRKIQEGSPRGGRGGDGSTSSIRLVIQGGKEVEKFKKKS